MKTVIELPDELMRAIKAHAANTDRTVEEVVTLTITRGLQAEIVESHTHKSHVRQTRTVSDRQPHKRMTQEALDAIFAAGNTMTAAGVDFAQWARTSREVWR